MKRVLTIQLYTINEFDEDTKNSILERFIDEHCYDYFPDDDWSEPILLEARDVYGLDIQEYDIYRGYIKAELIDDPKECIKAIRENSQSKELLDLADLYEKILTKYYYEYGDNDDEDDEDRDDANEEYEAIKYNLQKDLSKYYLKELDKEYYYYFSKEHVNDYLEANEIYFTKDGTMIPFRYIMKGEVIYKDE